MSITARTTMSRSRKRRELWHRKFVFFATVELEGRSGFFDIRFETMLRRWSVSRKRWLYLRPTPSRGWALIGTDMRIDRAAP
jgi:hypothetical protein